MATFAENLDLLWQVQELDRKIVAARHGTSSIRKRAVEEQKKLGDAEKRLQAEEAALKQMHVHEREIEQELQQLDKRIQQIETVPGSESAVEKHRARIDELETEGITLLTKMTEQKERINEAARAIEARKAEQGEKQSANAQQESVHGAQEEEARAQRDALTAGVPEEMLRVYNSLHEKHPGNALTTVNGEYCAACSGQLNMNLVVRARAREEFVRCPYCNRVLDPARTA